MTSSTLWDAGPALRKSRYKGLGGARVEPYPFRLIPHLQAEAGRVKRTGSHMQREKPEKKTETRERGKERID